MTVFAQEVMTPIKLSGSLATRFGRNHQRVISHTKEAFKALSVTIPGFEEYLVTAKKRGLTFAIFKGGKNIGKDELDLASGGQEIRIVPVIIGSKKAGVFQTILGAVLVVAGIVVTGLTWGYAAPVGGAMINLGAAMMVGGVVQMLSPNWAVLHPGNHLTTSQAMHSVAQLTLRLRVTLWAYCMASVELAERLYLRVFMLKIKCKSGYIN